MRRTERSLRPARMRLEGVTESRLLRSSLALSCACLARRGTPMRAPTPAPPTRATDGAPRGSAPTRQANPHAFASRRSPTVAASTLVTRSSTATSSSSWWCRGCWMPVRRGIPQGRRSGQRCDALHALRDRASTTWLPVRPPRTHRRTWTRSPSRCAASTPAWRPGIPAPLARGVGFRPDRQLSRHPSAMPAFRSLAGSSARSRHLGSRVFTRKSPSS